MVAIECESFSHSLESGFIFSRVACVYVVD